MCVVRLFGDVEAMRYIEAMLGLFGGVMLGHFEAWLM